MAGVGTISSLGSSSLSPTKASSTQSNAQTAYDFFLGKGLTSAQSAGIVGNLITESGVNPESVQSNGPGRGIAQWSLGQRWNPALMTGNAATDLTNQLNFIWQELTSTESASLTALQATTTPQQAAASFSDTYERPKGTPNPPSLGAREQNAANVYAAGNATLTSASSLWGDVGGFSGIVGSLGVSGAGAAVGGTISGATSSLVSGIEGYAVRIVIGLVGAVLIIAALIIAARQSDTGAAVEDDTAKAAAVGAVA